MTNLRLFLANGEQVPVTRFGMRQHPACVAEPTASDPFPPMAPGIGGTFEAWAEGRELKPLQEWRDKWRLRLTGAHVWGYWNAYFFAAHISYFRPLPAEVSGASHLGFSCHLVSSGWLWDLPFALTPYLPQIVAFESSLPSSLMAYHDWCEEQGWEERRQALRRQWDEHRAMEQSPVNMALRSPSLEFIMMQNRNQPFRFPNSYEGNE